MKLQKLLSSWLPVLAWALLIFYLSSIPNLKASPNPFWDEILRSGIHFVIYLIFFLLWFRAFKNRPFDQRSYYSLLLVLLYSFSDETHQHFVPSRTFQVKDLLINNAGSLSALLLVKFFLPKAPPEMRKLADKLDLV